MYVKLQQPQRGKCVNTFAWSQIFEIEVKKSSGRETSILSNEAKCDTSAAGLFLPLIQTTIRIWHNASEAHEKAKKRAYNERVQQVQHSSF